MSWLCEGSAFWDLFEIPEKMGCNGEVMLIVVQSAFGTHVDGGKKPLWEDDFGFED